MELRFCCIYGCWEIMLRLREIYIEVRIELVLWIAELVTLECSFGRRNRTMSKKIVIKYGYAGFHVKVPKGWEVEKKKFSEK